MTVYKITFKKIAKVRKNEHLFQYTKKNLNNSKQLIKIQPIIHTLLIIFLPIKIVLLT